MKIKKSHRDLFVMLVAIAILIIPQTRNAIKVTIHKTFTLFSPSVVKDENRVTLDDYHWKLIDNGGCEYNFKETKDKVVFLNLWATWCPPCIAEMPKMQLIYNDYKDQVVFLFVSYEDAKKVQKFLDKKGYQLPNFQPVSDIPQKLFSSSIPATYIINKKGEIVVDKKGAANWNSDFVRGLLDSLLLE